MSSTLSRDAQAIHASPRNLKRAQSQSVKRRLVVEGTGGPLSRVPVWVGRALQIIAIALLAIALTDAALPDGVYWAASYFEVFGLSPQPFLFNAVLLFFVGTAATRRIRGAMVFLIIFELPVVLMPPLTVASDAIFGNPLWNTFVLPIDVLAATLAALLILLLMLARHEFTARLQPGAYALASAVFLSGVLLAVVLGGLLSLEFPGTLSYPSDGWWWSLNAAVGFYPNDWMLIESDTALDTGVELLVASVSGASLLAAVGVLLYSARTRRLISATEELQLRSILHTSHTDDSLAYFATRRDKSVVFSPDGKAAVSYRTVNGMALASGDPIGPEEAWESATTAWLRLVQESGWRPAVVAATERGAEHYARYGMRGTVIGDEAVIHLGGTHSAALLRDPQILAARRRAQRNGYTVRFRRQSECSVAELREIAALSDAWRDGTSERGFSMALSRVGDASDASSLIVSAHDADGRITAFLVFVPWNNDGLSLDLMRRSPGAINGVNEAMISSLALEAERLGISQVSLNFAVLREVFVRGARVGAGRILKLQRWFLLQLSRKWQLESLRQANEKYHPEWRSRFIMRGRRLPLGQVLIVVGQLEGFLPSVSRHPQQSVRPAEFATLAQELTLQVPPSSGLSEPLARRSPRVDAAIARQRAGEELYPVAVPRTHSIAATIALIDATPPGDTVLAESPRALTGRVVARRRHGGVTFVELSEDHTKLQIVATREHTAGYERLVRVNLGDIISVTGRPGWSNSGEPSLLAESWQLAAKSLQAPPNLHTGLRDPEAQVRSRHIHLATSAPAADLIRARSQAVAALRKSLAAANYMEVETPILQNVHGGANARPFVTHIHAYNRQLSLRIAPELALKKLIIAGFPQVFEIGRNFRNEGVDATHNPEFTALEAYRAFADYTDMRVLAEQLIKSMLTAVSGSPSLVAPDGHRVDVSAPWEVRSVCDALTDRIGVRIHPDIELEALTELCRFYGAEVRTGDSVGHLIERLYEELIESDTTLPTFYTDFPSATSPLTRPHRSIAGLSERWDLVAFGTELGTAYSELADPIEQRRRLTEQSLLAANGDPEAMQLDEDFLRALEYGMPPTGGLGLGVDRIVMAATGASIRQTLAFPFVR